MITVHPHTVTWLVNKSIRCSRVNALPQQQHHATAAVHSSRCGAIFIVLIFMYLTLFFFFYFLTARNLDLSVKRIWYDDTSSDHLPLNIINIFTNEIKLNTWRAVARYRIIWTTQTYTHTHTHTYIHTYRIYPGLSSQQMPQILLKTDMLVLVIDDVM